MANFDSLITVKRNGELGARFEFSERPWASVGSHEDCDIRVHADGVAVLHALITLADGEPRVYGLDAAAPVRLPARGIELRNSMYAALDHGDVFYCGARCFRFEKKDAAARRRRSSMRRRRKSMVVTDRGEKFVVPDATGEVIAKKRMTLPAERIAEVLAEDLDLPPPASYDADQVQPLAESSINITYAQPNKNETTPEKTPAKQSKSPDTANAKTPKTPASSTPGIANVTDEVAPETLGVTTRTAAASTRSAAKTPAWICITTEGSSDSDVTNNDDAESNDSDFSPPSGDEDDEEVEEEAEVEEVEEVEPAPRTPLRAGATPVKVKTPVKEKDDAVEKTPKKMSPEISGETQTETTPEKNQEEVEEELGVAAQEDVKSQDAAPAPVFAKIPGKPSRTAAMLAKRSTELLQPAVKKQRLPPRTPGRTLKDDSTSGSIRPPTRFSSRRTPVAVNFTRGPVATPQKEPQKLTRPTLAAKKDDAPAAGDFTPRRVTKKQDPPASAFTPRRNPTYATPKKETGAATPACAFTPRRNTNLVDPRESRTRDSVVPASAFTPRRLQATPKHESRAHDVAPPASAFTPRRVPAVQGLGGPEARAESVNRDSRRRAVLTVPDVDEYASRLPQLKSPKSPARASPPASSPQSSASKPVINKLVAKTPGVAPPAVSPVPSPRSSGRTAKSTFKATVDGQENVPPRRLSRTRINQGVFVKSPLANASPKSSPWTHTSHDQKTGEKHAESAVAPVTLTVTPMQPLVSPAKSGGVEDAGPEPVNEVAPTTPKRRTSTTTPRKRAASMGGGASSSRSRRTPRPSRKSAGPVRTIVKTPAKGRTPGKARAVAFAEVHLPKGPHYSPAVPTPQTKLRYAGDKLRYNAEDEEMVPQDVANPAPRVPGEAPAPLKNLGRFFFLSSNPAESQNMDAQDEVSDNDVAETPQEEQPRRKSLTERLSGLFRRSPAEEDKPEPVQVEKPEEQAEVIEEEDEEEESLEKVVEEDSEEQEPRRRSLIGAARYLASGVLSSLAASPARTLLGIGDGEASGDSSEGTSSSSEMDSTEDDVEVATHRSSQKSSPQSAATSATVTPVLQPMAVDHDVKGPTPTNQNLLDKFNQEAGQSGTPATVVAKEEDTKATVPTEKFVSPAKESVVPEPVERAEITPSTPSDRVEANDEEMVDHKEVAAESTSEKLSDEGSEEAVTPQLDEMAWESPVVKEDASGSDSTQSVAEDIAEPDEECETPARNVEVVDDETSSDVERRSEPVDEKSDQDEAKAVDEKSEAEENTAAEGTAQPEAEVPVTDEKAKQVETVEEPVVEEPKEPTDYSKWTVKELRQYLNGLDITLGKGMRKADLIKAAQEADGTAIEEEVEVEEQAVETAEEVVDEKQAEEKHSEDENVQFEEEEAEEDTDVNERKEELKGKLGKKTVAYLRDLMEKLDLDAKGRKADLVETLVNESMEKVEEVLEEAEAPQETKTNSRRTPARKAKVAPDMEVVEISDDEVEEVADENTPPPRVAREEELKTFTVKKLKTILGKLKLDKAGKKSELIERILESEFPEKAEEAMEEEVEEEVQEPVKEPVMSKAKNASPPTTRKSSRRTKARTPIDDVDLTKLTVPKLRRYLQQHGASTDGLKAVLLERATQVQMGEWDGANDDA